MPDTSWWDDEYREHALWSEIDDFIGSLTALDQEYELDVDQQRKLDISRERLTTIKGRQDSQALLVTPEMMQEALTVLSGTRPYRETIGHLDTLYNAVNVFTKATLLWPTKRDAVARGVLQLIREEKQSATSRFQELQEEIDVARSVVSEHQSRFEAQTAERDAEVRAQIATLTAELQEAFETEKAASDEVIGDIKSDVTILQKQLTSLEETIRAQTARIQDAHASQVTDFADFKKDLEDESEEFQRKAEDSYDTLHGTLQAKYEASEKKLETSIEQVDALVAAAGGKATATDYGTFADSEKSRADVMLGIAVGLMALAVTVVFLAFTYIDAIGNTSMQNLFFKASLSFPLVAIAWVLVKESRKHRHTSNAAKDMQLRLLAFEPFLANVQPEKREELRQELVQQLFIGSHLGFELQGDSEDKKK